MSNICEISRILVHRSSNIRYYSNDICFLCFHFVNMDLWVVLFFNGIGNPEGLGAELLETLVKMAPTKEEEIKLKNFNGDLSKLGSAERFLKAVLDIPFAFKRVEAMLYRANFDSEINYLKKSFQTLEVWLTFNSLLSLIS